MTSTVATGVRARTLRASGWATIGFGAGQVIRFGGNLILTHLLMPETFGIMAIAWLVMTGLAMFSDTGIRQCIVHSRNGESARFLDTAWSIQILRGAALTCAALSIGGLLELARRLGVSPADSVYAHPGLAPVVAAIAFTALMSGLESTKFSTAYRQLDLARITAVDLACQVAGLVAMVGMARLYPSIWALVFGTIIVGPLRIALSHWALPGAPNRWCLDREHVREILGFGKWIVLSSLLSFAVVSGDRIVLGGLTDASTLGQYALAIMIVNAIQQLINAIIGNVALPALSEVHRNRPAQLRQAFYRLRIPVDIAALVLAGFLFAAGSRITGLLYDERYHLAGPALEILSLTLFAVRYEIATQCYLALGKAKLIVPPMAARLLPLFILTPVAFHLGGFQAAVWVIALVPLAGVPVHLYLMRRLGILDLRRELAVLPCMAIGLLAGRAFAA